MDDCVPQKQADNVRGDQDINFPRGINCPSYETADGYLPITEGCTHNSHFFCDMYQEIPFRMLSLTEVEEYLQDVKQHYGKYCSSMDYSKESLVSIKIPKYYSLPVCVRIYDDFGLPVPRNLVKDAVHALFPVFSQEDTQSVFL